MKTSNIILTIMMLVLLNSCVQKAYLKTIVINLTTPNKKNIQKVGIRGNGKPLSWQQDYEMKPVVKDSLYTATITIKTAYKEGEIKFTIDDIWELQNKPNRTITLSTTSDTTIYNATFDKE
jgi:hypothetical protein